MPLFVLVVFLSIVVPTAIALGVSWLNRYLHERDGRRSPIENRKIFGPGEQLRRRIEDHTDEMLGGILTLFWLGPYFLAVWALPKLNWSSVRFNLGDAILFMAFIVFVAFAIRHTVKHGVKRRRAREGLKAELYTAQELNRLLADGCAVFHDVPGEQFNLDHVVIGPKAVYVVETKSVRKPPKAQENGHKIRYDGELLHFPHFVSSAPLKQARRQADWLRTYLQATLRTNVPVIPTVALPGWWIDTSRALTPDAVRVFNPTGRGASFMATESETAMIGAAQAGLIAQAIFMRFPSDTK